MQKLQDFNNETFFFFSFLHLGCHLLQLSTNNNSLKKNCDPFFFVEQMRFRRKLLFTAKVNRNFFFLQAFQPLTHFFFLVHLEHKPTNSKNQEDPTAVYFKIKSKQQKRIFWFKRFYFNQVVF